MGDRDGRKDEFSEAQRIRLLEQDQDRTDAAIVWVKGVLVALLISTTTAAVAFAVSRAAGG